MHCALVITPSTLPTLFFNKIVNPHEGYGETICFPLLSEQYGCFWPLLWRKVPTSTIKLWNYTLFPKKGQKSNFLQYCRVVWISQNKVQNRDIFPLQGRGHTPLVGLFKKSSTTCLWHEFKLSKVMTTEWKGISAIESHIHLPWGSSCAQLSGWLSVYYLLMSFCEMNLLKAH